MGNSYVCPSLTCDAQRIHYVLDNYKPETYRSKPKSDQLTSIIKLNDLSPYDDFMRFHKLISQDRDDDDFMKYYSDLRDPDDNRYFKDLEIALHNLKIWCLMRGWDQSIYKTLKAQIKIIYADQLKTLTHERHLQQQNTLTQIRQDILTTMEHWIQDNQISQSKMEHHKFSIDGYLELPRIDPLSKPPVRNRDWGSAQYVLGWDKIYAAHAINLSPLIYNVPLDHPRLGGAKLIMSTNSFSFQMAGSCMSYGGDSFGGISNEERNRRERAKPRTYHLVLTFNLELIKY